MGATEQQKASAAGGTGWRGPGIAAAAAFFALAASFANLLHYHGYPWLRFEVLILLAGCALVAALFSAFFVRSASRYGQAIAAALLVALCIDLNADVPWVAAGAGIAVAVLRLWRGISVLPVVAIVGGVVLLTSVAGLGEQRAAITRTERVTGPAGTGPAILHLILDEHIGIDGIDDPVVRREVIDLYRRHGFRLFTRAYGRHFHSVNAIPDILNFGRTGDNATRDKKLDAGHTAYLSALQARGYQFHFYQTDFADFCRYHRAATCTHYWSPSLAFVDPLAAKPTAKAGLIAFKLMALSDGLRSVANFYDGQIGGPMLYKFRLPNSKFAHRGMTTTLGGFGGLKALSADIGEARRGHVYFAHLLIPHHPYVTASDCRIAAPSEWTYSPNHDDIAVRQRAYLQQVRCLGVQLDRTILAFRSSPGGRDGIIIIHGDHGSRITTQDVIYEGLTRARNSDLLAVFSTLFAVKAPGIAPGIEHTPYAVPDLLKALSDSNFKSIDAAPPGSGHVFLGHADWRPGRATSIAGAWPLEMLNGSSSSASKRGR